MIMKKNRLFSLILALGIVAQSLFAPVFAAPEESSSAPSESIGASSDPTGVSTVPKEFVIPENITGDASVHMGSRTLDAQRPLADAQDYTVDAKAAILYELNSDTLILAQDADVQLYPASLTKVMTCLLTMEHAKLDDIVTVNGDAIDDLPLSGSSANLVDGEQMTVENMLYCLMVASANDGACVLAEHVAGDEASFVEMMNQKAQELGCTGTHFANPHGLHDENHYTTARDLAKIFKAALEYPVFHEIYGVDYYTVPATNMSEARELESTNYLIRNAGYPVVIDSRVLGGKTGFTTPAGRCLMTVAERDGMKVLTVILGTTATYGSDGYSILRYGNFEENINLLDFCYETYTTAQVLSSDQVAGQFPVTGGDHDAFGMVTEGMYAVLPQGSGYESVTYEYDLTAESLTAPVQKDQQIGVIRVWYEDKCIAQQTLLSGSDVAVRQVTAVTEEPEEDPGADNAIVHGLLIGAVILLALVGLFVVIVRVRAAMRRARRRRARAMRGRTDRNRQRRR